MNFLGFFIKRKVTVAMIYILVIMLGVIAWYKLPKEFMPTIDFPQLTVITSYPHASSEEVENLITKPIEEACGTARGVRRIYSFSREGTSFVTVEFTWGTNMDFASLNLREKIDLAKGKLPREANEPRIERFNPFAMPVLILSLSGNRSSEELLELAKRPIAEILEKVDGVAKVSITGGKEREIQVKLYKDRINAHSISVLDVADKIKENNITFPAGAIKDNVFEYTVRVMGLFQDISDISKIAMNLEEKDELPSREKRNKYLAQTEDIRMVNVGMLADIEDGFKDVRSYSRFDGKQNISISILKQGDAFIVDVADGCKKKLDVIARRLPKDVELKIVYDESIYIENSIKDLINNGISGAILAFLVILLFLGNLKDSIIVSVSIPISILIALFLLHTQGVTINTISLAGLILGIGQLVDSSIVVQENIARHRGDGDFIGSLISGAKEVMGSVVGSILTTVVVFLPLIFVPGIIGQVFRDLSLSIVFSLLASLVVAFTLVPMLASLSEQQNSSKKWDEISSKVSNFTYSFYKKIMDYCFKNIRLILLLFVMITLFMLFILVKFVSKEMFPPTTGTQFIINVELPVGTNIEVTNRVSEYVEHKLQKEQAVKHYSTTIGSVSKEGVQILGQHEARIVVDVYDNYRKTMDEVIDRLKQEISFKNNRLAGELEGANLSFTKQGSNFSVFASGGIPGHNKPVVVEIKGHELALMEMIAKDLKDKFENIKGLYDIGTSVSVPGPEMFVKVEQDNLSKYNLTVTTLAKTILTAINGDTSSKFREEGKEIDIRVALRKEDTHDVKKLTSLFIKSPLKFSLPIEAVADIEVGEGPSEILRINQERTILVSARRRGISIEQFQAQINPILEELNSKYSDLTIVLAGESESVKDSYNSLKLIIILSILFVYMVMASEFESLLQPFLILFTIPMSLIGIVPGLLLSGHSLSIMSGMGIVLVGGLVVNNGIVLIDFMNLRLEDMKNIDLKDIIFESSFTRLRPIFMTAFTAILGLLPLMLNIGGNSEMQAPMATVVVWGLVASTFLTLIILPVLYYLVMRRRVDKR